MPRKTFRDPESYIFLKIFLALRKNFLDEILQQVKELEVKLLKYADHILVLNDDGSNEKLHGDDSTTGTFVFSYCWFVLTSHSGGAVHSSHRVDCLCSSPFSDVNTYFDSANRARNELINTYSYF